MRLLSSQNQPSFLKSVSVKELACKAEKIEKNEKVEKSNEVKKNEKDSAKRQLQKNKFKNLNKDVGARGEWSILEVSYLFS
jgi:transposase